MKTTLFAVALMIALIPVAVAQDYRVPQASLDREVDVRGPAQTASLGRLQPAAQTPPSYCKPCLFYAGDWDSNASDANGLANEVDIIVSTGAAVYTPFIVPKGKTWTVTGLFTDNFMLSGAYVDPKTSPYEIRKGIPKAGGSGGTLVCHGTGATTLVDTGNVFLIVATKVSNIQGCQLPAGKYWMSVLPYCTNKNDSSCDYWRAFLANDDGAMANRFGPLEPANDSFFNSVFFGANWEPSSEQQSSSRFSVGVEGTAK
jgi:hypothetical protein